MSNILAAQIADVTIGHLTIPGLMTEDGAFYVGVPQIAVQFTIPNKHLSRDIKALLDKDFVFTKIHIAGTRNTVNAIALKEFALLSYRLSVAGKDTTGKATVIARAYYEYRQDLEKLSILDGLKALEKSNHKALKSRTSTQREKDIQEKFAVLWQCEKEYPVEFHQTIGTFTKRSVLIGRADLVNDSLVAEIKECKQWKHAMGQLLAYQVVLQRAEIWLILFNSKDQPRDEIKTLVSRFGIKVKFIRN